MADKVCNVFISHIHEDDHRLQPLKDLLKDHGCEARDASITSEKPNQAKDPDYIMNEYLKPGIDWAGTLIVLVTPDTKDSAWVAKEVEYAEAHGKNIVGVWDDGEHGCELPAALAEFGDHMVPWDGPQIVDAIFDRIDGWRDPKGRPMAPRSIPHHRC
jgi:hypothetical protein